MDRPKFRVAWRGYDRAQVDSFVGLTFKAIEERRQRTGPAEPVDPEAWTPGFAVVLRGYDRAEVDAWMLAAGTELAALG